MSDRAAEEDRIARLRLIRSENIGPMAYAQLVARFGSATAALDAIPALAARGGGRTPRIAGADAAKREIETVARLGARHLFAGLDDYPLLLAQTDAPPPALIVKGRGELAFGTAVAIVGARNASAAGCRLARQFAAALGASGIVIVSGLARGIDTAAHDGSMESGTIAVVAGGIDVVYPPENAGRQEQISERGLLVSEQPPGTEPRARHFPWRNRIIAGLAQGTLVMEAAPRSGSLITARNAAEYGREVMAIPGSPLDPRAQGCNLLIREGATLVQSPDDVMEALHPFGEADRVREPDAVYAPSEAQTDPSEADRRRIVGLLSPTPVHVDEIVRESGLPASSVQLVLLELELGGRLERHAGGKVSIG
jgi:DNA processing protein